VQLTDITRTKYPKCRLCSVSWGSASNARIMQRPIILNQLNKKCITLVLLYWYRTWFVSVEFWWPFRSKPKVMSSVFCPLFMSSQWVSYTVEVVGYCFVKGQAKVSFFSWPLQAQAQNHNIQTINPEVTHRARFFSAYCYNSNEISLSLDLDKDFCVLNHQAMKEFCILGLFNEAVTIREYIASNLMFCWPCITVYQ
jgi:hypothetical protein